ncbi:hypothetical protein MFIFM68171_08183 [Madurella fahalii]|uniref:Uncharacterized protein n=1 Tax=Madurella fahalii TaxID=1157608 RepID=A0ABQ0GJQ4_9PEZI
MSSGEGFDGLTLVTSSCWRLYKACKDSSEGFARLSTELISLHATLKETHDILVENGAETEVSRWYRLSMLCDGCRATLDELDAIITRYDSLGTQAQRVWDRVNFGLEVLSDIRERLVCSVTLLTAFNMAIINSATLRIERKIDKLLAEVQEGLREGSVITLEDSAQAISTDDVWMELRRDLEDVHISPSAAEQNRKFILEHIQNALAAGKMEELAPCDPPAPIRSEAGLEMKAPVPYPSSDSGYGGSIAHASERGSISVPTHTVIAANNAFEELRRQRTEWWPRNNTELLTPGHSTPATTADNINAAFPKIRRRARPISFIKKLVVREKAIIEAASNGAIYKVAECISLGMDINVRDRWGWSSLSMAAYGGHMAVARLLLDHGADLDNMDVDGETPTSLAAQRGHNELVAMFDEERELRDSRVRKSDKEVPRR